MTFFVFCMVLLWLVQPGWCTSQNFSWLGLMPMQIVMTATTAVLCYAATPRTPQEHVAASAVWLQEFAWTEADKPIKLEARSSMVPKDADLARQPMFCFETMMKLLYWSCFVYDHMKEQLTPNTGFSNASSHQEQQLEGTSFTARTSLSLDTALSLYNMTDSQSFWEIQQDTRCLIGWGSSTVVVAFRGTASMKNALADLQAWRIAHPPVRGKTWLGTRPLVHVGFLKTWLADGLKLKVVNQVLEAVQQCKQRSGSDQPITVLITGHSLGGALATLAAYDIRKQLLANKQSNSKVVCCTFAAPRTGNHAFAREYNAMVPDTWSVINDQDVVTREGKMLFLYKRPGQRVILKRGRPHDGQSVRHHLLTSYFHTILSVVLAQFGGLGFPDGMEGMIRLAEASPYVKDLLQTQMGMSLPEMRAFCQSDPASRSEQALPGPHLPSKGFWLIKKPSAPSSAATPRASATLTCCHVLFASVKGQEQENACIELGFDQPDCADCGRLRDYIKDEDLVAECHGCCTQAKNEPGNKFRSAVLEVCSHRLREFPHVETFLKERISSYPNMQVKYYFGAPPRLKLKAGTNSETIRIDHWKTEHIEEYLNHKLLATPSD
ncbi:hypothetical protein ABBQ38_010874 [Trebouxia sp. C0009 RCD-2024]